MCRGNFAQPNQESIYKPFEAYSFKCWGVVQTFSAPSLIDLAKHFTKPVHYPCYYMEGHYPTGIAEFFPVLGMTAERIFELFGTVHRFLYKQRRWQAVVTFLSGFVPVWNEQIHSKAVTLKLSLTMSLSQQ